MKDQTEWSWSGKWGWLTSFFVVVFALMPVSPAEAIRFDFDSFEGSLDTTVSYGASWRVQDRKSSLVGIANGGTRTGVNNDDGNLNYSKGIISNVAKITSELDLHNDNIGIFTRGSAFYDYENMNGDRDRAPLSSEAEEQVGKDAELLDAFIWTSFDLGAIPVQLRIGDQVVSWGESTFIRNGINVINPVNVSALRLPGSELKEGLIPEGMIWGSFGLTENLSLEGLYLYDWSETEVDPPGTYFSTNDYVGDGGEFVMLGDGLVPEGRAPFAIPRADTRNPGDSGQYGVAARLFVPSLNDTEFGFYYLNYHSRTPFVSALSATNARPDSGRYLSDYAEDIQLLGLTFATEIPFGGFSLQGEVSHRPDAPVQIDDVQILRKALGQSSHIAGPFVPGGYVQGYTKLDVTQVQTTMIKVFGPTLGADKFTLVGEAAVHHVHDLPNQENELALEGPRVGVDATSWGYRVKAKFVFFRAIGPINVSPKVAWRHDVDGNSPSSGTFLEDRKSILLGLGFDYQNTWSAAVSYTNFFGAGDMNKINDRDLIAFNVKYSF